MSTKKKNEAESPRMVLVPACQATHYSRGHKCHVECQLPAGHVEMHSAQWGGEGDGLNRHSWRDDDEP